MFAFLPISQRKAPNRSHQNYTAQIKTRAPREVRGRQHWALLGGLWRGGGQAGAGPGLFSSLLLCSSCNFKCSPRHIPHPYLPPSCSCSPLPPPSFNESLRTGTGHDVCPCVCKCTPKCVYTRGRLRTCETAIYNRHRDNRNTNDSHKHTA